MLDALETALEIDLDIEGAGSPDKIQFMDVARSDGLKAALAWRDARFPRARAVTAARTSGVRRSTLCKNSDRRPARPTGGCWRARPR